MTAFSVDTFCDRCARPIRSRNHIGTLCTHCGPDQPVGEMPEGIVRAVKRIDAHVQAVEEIRAHINTPRKSGDSRWIDPLPGRCVHFARLTDRRRDRVNRTFREGE